MANSKGNSVELSTFLGWGKSPIIGHKTEETNGKVMVNQVWCKLCAKYKKELQNSLKGSAKKNSMAFVDGTNSVTKHQVIIIIFQFYVCFKNLQITS